MHNSAYKNGQKFFDKYCKENINNKKILDVGSFDVNGTLKPIFAKGQYIGMDLEEGKNVDVVGNGHNMPFDSEEFDIVISTSCFEHDEMFWVTFLEMSRVLKVGGYIYINAPSAGYYHGYPKDCWRFYFDSWKALEKWAQLNKFNIQLIENYIDTDNDDFWKDSVGIFKKI